MSHSESGNLSPDRTFVVQLRSDSDARQHRLSGRIEHIVSGESAPFDSLEALLGFFAQFTTTQDGGPK